MRSEEDARDEPFDDEDSFMLRKRSEQEIADYDEGFAAGSEGKECDITKSLAWQRGWAEAQEQLIMVVEARIYEAANLRVLHRKRQKQQCPRR
jgi:hypothetical protein